MTAKFAIWSLSLILLTCSILPRTTSAASTLDRIEDAYIQGSLTYEEALLFKVYSLYSPDKVPMAYRGDHALKSGTPVILEVRQNWEQLSRETKEIISSYLTRPYGLPLEYNSEGGHFKLHYTNTGYSATEEDFMLRFARYFDRAWALIVDTMGYMAPPSDGSLGGDGRFDIYIRNLLDVYGITYPEGDGPNPWDDAYSYIEVHNNYDGFPHNDDPDGSIIGAQKVTSIHEFFHAVQVAYDQYEAIWWMEISSVWMEEYGYPYVNDYLIYVEDFYDDPHLSLTSTSGTHMYSCGIFNIFLEKTLGADTIRYLWESCMYRDAQNALRWGLGDDFNNLFSQFTVWNLFTDSLHGPEYYDDGARYPSVRMENSHNTYPVTSGGTSHRPQNLASNYIRFKNSGYSGALSLSFTGDESTTWKMKVIKFPDSGVPEIINIPVNPSGSGNMIVPSFENYRSVIMIPAPVGTSIYSSYDYSYSASVGSDIYPAPLNLNAVSGQDGQVPLYWRATPGSAPDSFYIYRRLPAASMERIASTLDTMYIDCTVTNGITYQYAVTALYGEEESAYSNIISASPRGVGDVDTVDIILDNGEGITYSSYWNMNDIVCIRFLPEEPTMEYKLLTVSVMLYDLASAGSQNIRIRAYNVGADGMPFNEIGVSDEFVITDFYPDWATVDVSGLDITIPDEAGIIVGFEYTSGTYREIPSILCDDHTSIPRNINFYWTDSEWWEHYDFWSYPDNCGYNMIRGTFQRTTTAVSEKPSRVLSMGLNAYPNPFNSEISIAFAVPEDISTGAFQLSIFNLLGELVYDLTPALRVNKAFSNGDMIRVTWEGADQFGHAVPSGIYMAVLNLENKKYARKIVLMK
ncbi:T9SS type A sorting domain-containing protein [bacterium]|nr:T9SS type A sorting domain-containing protein [bacterium]